MNKLGLNICIIFFVSFLSVQHCNAQYFIKDSNSISLNGQWLFALDPLNAGQAKGWYKKNFSEKLWDKVQVPHCFSVDMRYLYYTGTVWYRRSFPWTTKPKERIILHFDAVYYLTDIWVNDHHVGIHEGGYTPFEFDVTSYLNAGNNIISLSVNNNTWAMGTVPGAKDYGMPGNSFMGWMNYGGIIRPVYLTIEPEDYIDNIKVEAVPDLVKGNASLKVTTFINHNSSNKNSAPALAVQFDNQTLKLDWQKPNQLTDSNNIRVWQAIAVIKANDVKLWDIDDPNLYTLKAMYNTDTFSTQFGIRKVEVKNAQLLLNGHPIKAAGANRVVDYPGLGSLEPDSLVEKDFKMMKQAGMIFQRMTHYAPNEYFYNLADKYGMLIIAEAGNWQLTPDQLDSDTIRKKYKSQLSEMMYRDWNHPCVIAYSVGNEYGSDKAPGLKWTKDMIAFGRGLDSSRLFTFASSRLNTLPSTAEDEASQYCDFICTNTYNNHVKVLENIHSLYPQKPVLISEWGDRVDYVGDTGLMHHIKTIVDIVRKYPYVIGASIWTYNDYESRLHGTNSDGYRAWGLVDPYRNPRQAYYVYQQEMCPATMQVIKQNISKNGEYEITVRIIARNNFPQYPMHHYYLRANETLYPIYDIKPGESRTIIIHKKGFDDHVDIGLYTPTGFCILDQKISIHSTE